MDLPVGADRDFTASAFVVADDRVLLVHHRKLGQWVQPGGHIDDRETPDQAARREVLEETGYRVSIQPSAPSSRAPGQTINLPRPFRVNLHKVRPDHWHVDFVYLATVGERAGQPPDDGPPLECRWVSRTDLDHLHPIDDQTRRMATAAIDRLADDPPAGSTC